MYTNIISNPTWDTIKQFMQDALRCTWPNISVIRSHCEVELMLDRSARSLAKLYQGAVSCKPISALHVLYETSHVHHESLHHVYHESLHHVHHVLHELARGDRGLGMT
jgi:RecB family endonuclease NucS